MCTTNGEFIIRIIITEAAAEQHQELKEEEKYRGDKNNKK